VDRSLWQRRLRYWLEPCLRQVSHQSIDPRKRKRNTNNPPPSRTVTYTADVQASGNWYLSLYGWTKSPLVEFYIVESFGSYDPSSAASSVGTADIDGSTYTLLQTTRENQPSIEGTSTFQQYWAVRADHRTSGSIDFGAHIDAWAGAGLDLGAFDYMILATEGYQSSGSATVTVS
jgi:endo-1,4-beta-xylanase